MEHEATTTKIGEDQIFYCNQRGLDTEEAVSVVNDFERGIRDTRSLRGAQKCWALVSKVLWLILSQERDDGIIEINTSGAGRRKQILNGINLSFSRVRCMYWRAQWSGKSTLSNVLAGNESYEQTGGTVLFDGVDLSELDAHERARAGLFLAFQASVEIAGISNMYF